MILAIGPGDASRIYRTTDGGASWDATFVNDDPAAFYDCMAFYPGGRRGLALSDPVDGKFRILSTQRLRPLVERAARRRDARGADGVRLRRQRRLPGHGRQHTAYFGSGGGASRVFRSDDFGLTWTASDSTIPPGDAAGVFALAFRTPRQGIAVGGDFADAGRRRRRRRDHSPRHAPGATPATCTHLGEDVAYLPDRGHRAPRHRRVRRRDGHQPQHSTAAAPGPGSATPATTRSTAPATAPAGPPAATAASPASPAEGQPRPPEPDRGGDRPDDTADGRVHPPRKGYACRPQRCHWIGVPVHRTCATVAKEQLIQLDPWSA